MLVALVPQPHVQAAEGRVADKPAIALESGRISNYSGRARTSEPAPEATSKTHSAPTKRGALMAGKSGAVREKRSPVALQSNRAAYFYIYDAGSALLVDRDDDRYYSEFKIRFDADATFGDARVYAKLYLRRFGELDWFLYHVTEDFWIHEKSPDDDYFVTTTLDEGWPTSEYDVLIDLHEVGFEDVVATLGPDESAALELLPLEEAGLDAPIETAGFSIRGVRTSLLIDEDADGHYSRFGITFDPDADFDGAWLYARIWVRPLGGEWIEEHVSEDFLVDASGDADVYTLTADWISGYPTAYYDVQIDLHDPATGLLAASAGSERPELSRIPLEDEARDFRPSPPPISGVGGSASSYEGGGGALTFGWTLALLMLVVQRLGAAAAARSCSRAPSRMPGSA